MSKDLQDCRRTNLSLDPIARSKRILALVDDYHDRPTVEQRRLLRVALMNEFDCLLATQPASSSEKERSAPEGYASWHDAAVGERALRVAAEHAVAASAREGLTGEQVDKQITDWLAAPDNMDSEGGVNLEKFGRAMFDLGGNLLMTREPAGDCLPHGPLTLREQSLREFHAFFRNRSDELFMHFGMNAVAEYERAANALSRLGPVPIPGLNELRAGGLIVSAHHDYMLDGVLRSFWLMTRDDGKFFQGDACTDAEAIQQIANAASIDPPLQPSPEMMEDVLGMLKQGRIYLDSRGRMHPYNVGVFDSIVARFEAIIPPKKTNAQHDLDQIRHDLDQMTSKGNSAKDAAD